MNSTFFIILAIISFGCVHSSKKKKSVTTVIDAKWQVTPLVLEIAEYISDEDPSSFWKFVDQICSLEPPLAARENEKEYYDMAIKQAGSFLPSAQVSLLKFALSLHIYSPRVEMFNQIAVESKIDCEAAAEVSGQKIICDVTLLESAIEEGLKHFSESLQSSENRAEIFRLDHVHPGGRNGKNVMVVILYGELGTPEFAKFHKILKIYSAQNKIKYVIRHWVKNKNQRKLRLSGYGVELQMKSTEYKVEDDTKVEGSGLDDSSEEEEEVEGFNFIKLKQLYPDKINSLEKLRQELLESSSELAPLKVWQFQELSLQAAQRIMSAPKEESLNAMIHIAQNFPTMARSLVKTVVSQELKAEVRQNQDRFSATLHLQPSDAALFINGMFFDLESQDMFTILEHIRQELRVMEGIHRIGIEDKPTFKALLGLDLGMTGADIALDIRDSAVFWLNDIETDKQYRRWSSSLLDMLRPTLPGIFRSIRRNLYNLVVIGNPTDRSVRPLVKLLQSFLVHSAPLRLGLVFDLNSTKTGLEDGGMALLNAFNYISDMKDTSQAINFITDVYASVGELEITSDDVITLMKTKFPRVNSYEVFGADSDYNTGIQLAKDFIERSGIRKLPQALLNGVPLSDKSLSIDEFEEAVLSEIMNQTPALQKAIYRGDLTDAQDVVNYLMSQPNVMPRLNDRVLSISKNTYVDLTKIDGLTGQIVSDCVFYATNKINGQKQSFLMTNWIITDLSLQSGRDLLISAIEQMENSGLIRVGLLINENDADNKYHEINAIAVMLLKILPSEEATPELKRLLKEHKDVEIGTKCYEDYDLNEMKMRESEVILDAQERFSREVLGLHPGDRAIVSNGRLLGPFDESEDFTPDDFNLLERFSLETHVNKIHSTFINNNYNELKADMLMKTVSLLAARPESKSRFEILPYGEEHSVVKLSPLIPESPSFDIVAIVDPVSHGAHKLSSVIAVLQQVINSDIRIFLNCIEKNSDMPLKSFYRFVLEPYINFNEKGEQVAGPFARFSNMPGIPLLTQNMLVPDNWMVESIASPHDLDNIRLDQVDSNVHSQFELEYLILEGHCFDTSLGSPPRGLQITLGTDSSPTLFDTIVMANLGYFQLKANPGAWKLRLRHGRSASLFDISGYSHESIDYTVNSSEIKILLSSFRSHTVKLKVTKKPDKMGVDLLGDDGEEQQGLWGSITSTFTGGGKDDTGDGSDEKINIFSVASGHLYERFLKIMMLSILKHTKSPVKFWFLKNYLSPTLKDFLPRMATHYGFEFELVQYKWPRWLHQQTEKQRIIWGYKILFLDVLFPLDVKKIIFVDADQVVRADMKELVDLDLGGAPYAYTPFCDSRTEMDGFRFWRSGYWRNHLQGRKYHISALYVVDLKKFRRVAAGDRLRGQYQALSQDPNSLANLDQDLPNNMIHQVSIKSLPQEWLWCETWCDDQSKEKAKTIDLCNNPLTKEAKLTAAMRILPEWKGYDEEIKRLQLRLGDTEDSEEEHIQLDDSAQRTKIHSEL